MIIKVTKENAKKIERNYGTLYWLVIDEENFKNLRVHVISVDPGQQTSKHMHPQEEVIYILEGICVISSDQISYSLSVGETALIQPDTIHKISNSSNVYKLLYLTAMSPPRKRGTVKYYP